MITYSQITFHMFKMCVENKRVQPYEVHNGLYYLYYWYRE